MSIEMYDTVTENNPPRQKMRVRWSPPLKGWIGRARPGILMVWRYSEKRSKWIMVEVRG